MYALLIFGSKNMTAPFNCNVRDIFDAATPLEAEDKAKDFILANPQLANTGLVVVAEMKSAFAGIIERTSIQRMEIPVGQPKMLEHSKPTPAPSIMAQAAEKPDNGLGDLGARKAG